MERKYFGTDGVRGKVGNYPIVPEFVMKLGWAAGKVLSEKGTKKVIIGKDTRISGYMLEAALEAGAEDFKNSEDVFEIITAPNDMGTVRDALEEKGYEFVSAEVAYIPQNMTQLTDEAMIEKMEKLIDMMDENEDVQSFWHNWEE